MASAGMRFPTKPLVEINNVDLDSMSRTHGQPEYLALGGRVDICSQYLDRS